MTHSKSKKHPYEIHFHLNESKGENTHENEAVKRYHQKIDGLNKLFDEHQRLRARYRGLHGLSPLPRGYYQTQKPKKDECIFYLYAIQVSKTGKHKRINLGNFVDQTPVQGHILNINNEVEFDNFLSQRQSALQKKLQLSVDTAVYFARFEGFFGGIVSGFAAGVVMALVPILLFALTLAIMNIVTPGLGISVALGLVTLLGLSSFPVVNVCLVMLGSILLAGGLSLIIPSIIFQIRLKGREAATESRNHNQSAQEFLTPKIDVVNQQEAKVSMLPVFNEQPNSKLEAKEAEKIKPTEPLNLLKEEIIENGTVISQVSMESATLDQQASGKKAEIPETNKKGPVPRVQEKFGQNDQQKLTPEVQPFFLTKLIYGLFAKKQSNVVPPSSCRQEHETPVKQVTLGMSSEVPVG